MATKIDRSLSIEQVAEKYDVHPHTVRRWIAAGRLPAHRVGPRLLRIMESDLDAFARRLPTSDGAM